MIHSVAETTTGSRDSMALHEKLLIITDETVKATIESSSCGLLSSTMTSFLASLIAISS